MNLRIGFDPYTMAFGALTSGFGMPGAGSFSASGTRSSFTPPGESTVMTQDQSATQVQSNTQTVAIGSNLAPTPAPSGLDALTGMGVLGLPQAYSLPTLNLSSSAATPWGTYALIGGAVLFAVWYANKK